MNRVLVIEITDKDGRYMFQHGFEYCPLYPINLGDVEKSLLKAHPSILKTGYQFTLICDIEKDMYRPWKKYQLKRGKKVS